MDLRCIYEVLLFLVITSSVLANTYGRSRYPSDSLILDKIRYPAHVKLGSNSTLQSNQTPVAINFDTGVKKPTIRQYIVNETPTCDDLEGNQGFCTEDSEYNSIIEKIFNKILEEAPFQNTITDVLKETVIPINNESFPHLRNRVGFSSEETPCASVETIIYPKRGQTPNKDWVFILNQGPVEQGVKVEKCLNTNSPCRLGGVPIEQTACRQKYIYKKLLALNPNGNNIVSESIYLPSCCVCYVSNDFVSVRTGKRQTRP